MSSPRSGPIRLAIVNDYEIVVSGVASMLAEHSGRIAVIELDSRLPVVSEVDVILCDSFGQVVGDGVDLETLTGPGRPMVVVFSWSSHPDAVALSLARGARGHLSKGLSALELVEAIEAVDRGEIVTSPDVEQGDARGVGDWPGRGEGLSPREAEMLSFIAKGLSNQEIADVAYLSINSVKTYIRTAYRKIGVRRRPQAVVWALDHGFASRAVRLDTRALAGPEVDGAGS